jgi:hypothetical protein
MQLDDIQLNVGSAVHDIAYGAGKVTVVSQTGVQVEFGTSQGGSLRIAYSDAGVATHLTQRTLYASRPHVFPPLAKLDRVFYNAATKLHNELRAA